MVAYAGWKLLRGKHFVCSVWHILCSPYKLFTYMLTCTLYIVAYFFFLFKCMYSSSWYQCFSLHIPLRSISAKHVELMCDFIVSSLPVGWDHLPVLYGKCLLMSVFKLEFIKLYKTFYKYNFFFSLELICTVKIPCSLPFWSLRKAHPSILLQRSTDLASVI